jgi:GTP cyclohydrolase FolE2
MLEDIQAGPDHRGIAISEAGIDGLRYPVVVYDRAQGKQSTVAWFEQRLPFPMMFGAST